MGALLTENSSPATGSRFSILCVTTKRFSFKPSLAALISTSLLPSLAAAEAEGAAFTIFAMLPKLAAGAGTLTLSAARAASATLTSRALLQATAVNEKPTANIAAANALTATQREFSMPVIAREPPPDHKCRLPEPFSKPWASANSGQFADFLGAIVATAPRARVGPAALCRGV